MRYWSACSVRETEDWIYKNYVTECLKAMTGNTAKMGGGSAIGQSFVELLKPNTEPAPEGAEIIERLRSKLRNMERNNG